MFIIPDIGDKQITITGLLRQGGHRHTLKYWNICSKTNRCFSNSKTQRTGTFWSWEGSLFGLLHV